MLQLALNVSPVHSACGQLSRRQAPVPVPGVSYLLVPAASHLCLMPTGPCHSTCCYMLLTSNKSTQFKLIFRERVSNRIAKVPVGLCTVAPIARLPGRGGRLPYLGRRERLLLLCTFACQCCYLPSATAFNADLILYTEEVQESYYTITQYTCIDYRTLAEGRMLLVGMYLPCQCYMLSSTSFNYNFLMRRIKLTQDNRH